MNIPIYQVDAFVTGKPFSGNPAGVCLLRQPAEDDWMQGVAMEMNLSETAFLVPRPDGFDLRWFTPSTEVVLCGHATLASAHTLWESELLRGDEAAWFHTRSGLLTCLNRSDGWIEMDFPATPESTCPSDPQLNRALGLTPIYTGKNMFDYIVEVGSEERVRSANPDIALLRKINVRGVAVTSLSDNDEFDFVSRFFAPGSGVDEDPVTGSAHCCLGPYWSNKLGKNELVGYQASKRGGIVEVSVRGDRVKLAGRAVTTIRGEIVGQFVGA